MRQPEPELVGREEQLAAVAGAFGPDGLPAMVVLHGEAGIGKSTIWLAGLAAAAEAGYRVLSCRPSEAEARFSYAGLADLLEDVTDEVLVALPSIQRRALGRALLLDDAEGEADERAVAAAFLAALRHLAADRPLCVAVDDLQWLDKASLAGLRFALPRFEDARLVWLLAVRGEVPTWLPRMVPGDRLTTVEIEGLSVGALHEALRARLGRSLPRPTLVRIWETSGGNPFFALELARALERRGFATTPGDPLPLPSSLDELLRERLDGLGRAALDVAAASAALTEPTTELLGAAFEETADAGLAEALDARILELDDDRVRFSHPLLASAVSARQTHAARRSLHARLAVIAPTGEERARHLALATLRPDPETAAIVEEAALSADARGAPFAAAELADESLRLTPREASADRRRRLLLAADRYYAAADLERATVLLERARAEERPGRARAEVLVQLARTGAGPRDAKLLLETALAEAADDPALVAEIHLLLAGHMRFMEGIDRGLEHAELAVDAAGAVGDAATRCRALAAYGLLHFNSGKGVPAEMDPAVALERSLPGWPIEEGPALVRTHQLVWTSEVERARTLARELEAALEARGDVPGRADALWYLALAEWRAGDWREAERCAAADDELTALVGRAMANEGFPAVIVAAHLGRVDDAVRRAEAGIVGARGQSMPVAEQGFDWIVGFVRLSQGDPAGAAESLRRAHDTRRILGMREPAMCTELGDLLEALVATGELDAAEQVLEEWEPRAAALDRAWALALLARGRGLVHAARGERDEAFSAFDRSLAEHARVTEPFQHARTLLALGRTQRRAKRRAAARATLEDALARFEELGARLWAERAREELGRIGGRAPSRRSLTEAERRIAALVAEGRTNREVAAALFLTEHSVETALTRVYRKLGIRSRRELGRALSNT